MNTMILRLRNGIKVFQANYDILFKQKVYYLILRN